MDEIQGTYYNSQTGMPNRDFRPRRPHAKSKNGCNQCKTRRIKCDELKPRCTRCSKGDLRCKYPDTSSGGQAGPSERPRSLNLGVGTEPSDSSRPTAPALLGPAPTPSPGLHPISYQIIQPIGQLSLSTCNHHSRAPCPIGPPPPGLMSGNAELIDHFTQHSSQAINFDAEDSYALQVGIPTLVKDCPALAATILSVAATCQCVDIITRATPLPGDRKRVMALLAQANRHHFMSVQTMQRVIAAGGPSPHEHYDHVLANAWMMAAYGTASHRLRIWLHGTKSEGEILEAEFVPNHSGWISMFHNVHAVYLSILGGSEQSPQSAGHVPFSEEIIAPANIPDHISHHVLYPMLVSTSPDALQMLRQHAQHVALVMETTVPVTSEIDKQSLASSLAAIEILSDLISRIISTSSSPLTDTDHAKTTSPMGLQFDFTPREQGRFAELSPWLTKYLNRALAVTPSRPLRGLIMAFLYRVPRVYLDIIKRQLDSFPLDFDADSSLSSSQHTGQMVLDTLALDVFSHWLSFTLLLDGVWFFDDIGSWELGRIVAMVKSGRLKVEHCTFSSAGVLGGEGGDGPAFPGENWWPAKIYEFAEATKRGETPQVWW
ncbi:hypothetical protein V8F20_006357 [Naviculisporaceae sp. PSN 640]